MLIPSQYKLCIWSKKIFDKSCSGPLPNKINVIISHDYIVKKGLFRHNLNYVSNQKIFDKSGSVTLPIRENVITLFETIQLWLINFVKKTIQLCLIQSRFVRLTQLCTNFVLVLLRDGQWTGLCELTMQT